MSKYSQENSGRFEAEMEASGWVAMRDIFEGIHSWKHNGSGRVVSNSDALNYWQMAQSAPVPF